MMKIKRLNLMFALMIGGLFLITACSTTTPDIAQLKGELIQKDREIQALSADNSQKAREIDSLRQNNSTKDQTIQNYKTSLNARPAASPMTDSSAMSGNAVSLLPPKASPGECYARVFVPPTYRTETEQVLVKEQSERLEIIPAKYGWREDKVLIKEASERIEVEPAQYKWVEERVLVKAASTNLVEVPAKYGSKQERILVKEEHTVWKKGRGLIEKVDNTTGEIMCLVTVPATYRTVNKRTLISAPTTREVEIPAEYKTVKKRVMVKAPTRRTVTIPAEYKTMKVRTLVTPANKRLIPIPASYQAVTKTIKTSEGEMAWRRTLCETNVNVDMIRRIQAALSDAGMNPGPIDGVIGPQTNQAINTFQKKNNLAVGGLTYETIKRLKVNF